MRIKVEAGLIYFVSDPENETLHCNWIRSPKSGRSFAGLPFADFIAQANGHTWAEGFVKAFDGKELEIDNGLRIVPEVQVPYETRAKDALSEGERVFFYECKACHIRWEVLKNKVDTEPCFGCGTYYEPLPEAQIHAELPLEVNGPANIVMLLESAERAGLRPDLGLIKEQARLTVKYLEAWARGERPKWHEIRDGEDRG